MGLDKKQLPQLIVLGVLVLFSVGYISFKIAAPKAAVPPPAAKSGAQAPAAAQDDAEAVADSDALALLAPGDFPNLSVMPARRDPFTPQHMPGEKGKKPLQVNTAVRSAPNTKPNPYKMNQGANEKVPSLFDSSNPRVAPVEPKVKPEDLDPEFVLTGVVRGGRNVAIIRVGEDGRYVVREGQLIDGRYKVKSVTDDGAVLVYKNRSIHLKLGGVTNAS